MAQGSATGREERQVEKRTAPSGRIVYQAILREGDEELERPSSALFWSGLAAGLSMGFSMIAEGLLRGHLPEAAWRPLVAKLGYSMGFLIVVLGRQQLFTENTLTPILPLLLRRDRATLGNVARLWGVVLLANLLGALGMAYAIGYAGAFDDVGQQAFLEIGRQALGHSWGGVVARGVFAGWLIALMVWLLPFAEVGRIWIVILLTYVVGLGEFTHIVAGAVEVFYVAALGQRGWGEVLGGYILPTLLGNIAGGVLLVAVLNHAQVTAGGAGEDL